MYEGPAIREDTLQYHTVHRLEGFPASIPLILSIRTKDDRGGQSRRHLSDHLQAVERGNLNKMQIFYEIGERKGSMNKKFFEDSLRGILNMFCELSMKLKDAVVAAANENSLRGELVKLSKYSDQIILYILRVAPADLMDEYYSTLI